MNIIKSLNTMVISVLMYCKLAVNSTIVISVLMYCKLAVNSIVLIRKWLILT
jgi:hypothetical protein